MTQRRFPARVSGWLFALALVAAWLLGGELAVFTAVRRGLPSRLPGFAVGSLVAVSVAFLAVTGRREVIGGRQTERLITQLREVVGSFAMLTETSLGTLALDDLLQQLLARLCEVLDAHVAAVVMSDDGRVFTFRASCGLDVDGLVPFELAPGEGMIGAIVATRAALAVGDANRVGPLSAQLHRPLKSAAGCPILVEGRLIGVCVVGATVARQFDSRRLQLLQLVADRAGVEIERATLGQAQQQSRADVEHAGRNAAVLARASEVLLVHEDDEELGLVALLDVVVPQLADWCAIEITDAGGGRRSLGVRHGNGPGGGDRRDESSDPVGVTRWAEMAQMFPDVAPMAADVFASGTARVSAERDAVVVAVEVDDSVFAAITIALDPGRPTFEAVDVAAAVELAGRGAISVERARHHREVRAAAHASQTRAALLDDLVTTSLDVQQLGEESEILTRVAERARAVFDAQTAVVGAEIDGDGPMLAVAERGHETVLERRDEAHPVFDVVRRFGQGQPWRAGGWLGAPMPAREGRADGAVAINRPAQTGPAEQDDAVLVLLAQMASTALDKTAQFHATQTSEARWRVLVEAAPIAILEVDLGGGVLWWNRAAAALFAWPDAPPGPRSGPRRIDRSDGARFDPQTAARLRTVWSEVGAGYAVVDRELTAISAGGQLRDLAVSAAPLRSIGGAVYGNLTLVADVTERRTLEAELRRAQRLEAIGQLAGGVAHDFNNLLTLITGYTELLGRRLEVDGHGHELIDDVNRAVARATLLTGQLLTISKGGTARPVVLAPATALRPLAEVLERVLGPGIELCWALDPEAGEVCVDPGHLEQVIVNLAINARDAMPHGGRLRIATSPSTLDQARAAALEVAPGRYVQISVTDTGTGMDAATRARCFEPLFTTKGPSGGTGLGLAAVKGVVSESGGAISVESAPGKGTTFVVVLPTVGDAR